MMPILRSPSYLALVLAIASSAACRAGPGRLVDVRIIAPAPSLLSSSSHWNLPGPGQQVGKKGQEYIARIPAERIPMPFLDLNKNGRLDLDQEPIARCRRTHEWTCTIEPARLTVHRLQRPDHDSTIAVGDVRLPDSFVRDPTGKLCIWGEARCSDPAISTPYADGQAIPYLKLCDLTDKRDPQAEFGLELRSGDRVLVRARVHQPPAIELQASLRLVGGEYHVTGSTSLRIDRIVVWWGELENGETRTIRWNSEERPELLVRHEKDFELRLPTGILTHCPSCALGVQAVSDVAVGPVTTSSEGLAIFFPGKDLSQ